jgi:hypothetical protein
MLAAPNNVQTFDARFHTKVGDFGRIDPENGQFICEGNIYRDEPLASIAKDYPPAVHDPEYELKIDTSFLACSTRAP